MRASLGKSYKHARLGDGRAHAAPLPLELWVLIFAKIYFAHRKTLELVCKLWQHIFFQSTGRLQFWVNQPEGYDWLRNFQYIREMTVEHSRSEVTPVDFARLPRSLERLTLWQCDLPRGNAHFLPSLHYLKLFDCVLKTGTILPPSIQHLVLEVVGQRTEAGLECLPHSLRRLELDGYPEEITAKGWKRLPQSLRHFRLTCCALTDAALQYFPHSLERLSFSFCSKVTGNGLKHLPPSVQLLKFGHCWITDEALECLPPSIQHLELSYCHLITDEGLGYLSASQTLRHLTLHKSGITDQGLQYLPHSLHCLCLVDCDITDTGLTHLPESLRRLDVKWCGKLTLQALEYIPHSLKLHNLNFSYCLKITSEGLDRLAQFPKLQILKLSDCTLTAERLEPLPVALQLPTISECVRTAEGFEGVPKCLLRLCGRPADALGPALQELTQALKQLPVQFLQRQSEPASRKGPRECWKPHGGYINEYSLIVCLLKYKTLTLPYPFAIFE